MRRANAWLALSAAALASACRATDATAPAASPSPSAASAYLCDDGRTVRATYKDDRAWIEVDGRKHTLSIGPSGSGARYVGEGLQWWTRGPDRGRLSRLAPGEAVAQDPGVECSTRAPSLSDRTPEAAAQVVRRYFALLAEGRSAEAAALRSDGTDPGSTDPAAFYAVVGAPGQAEGAAGSIYVEVPVTFYPRPGGGAEAARQGQVVLRRVNDVPGASSAQLRWRIERVELQSGSGG